MTERANLDRRFIDAIIGCQAQADYERQDAQLRAALGAKVEDVIWTQLEQIPHRFGHADRESGSVDTVVEMDRIAAAVVDAFVSFIRDGLDS